MIWYCTVLPSPDALTAHMPGSPNAWADAAVQLTINWQDGTSDTIPRGTAIADKLGNATVDGYQHEWLIVVTQGVAALLAIIPADRINLDTITSGGKWACFARLLPDGVHVERQ